MTDRFLAFLLVLLSFFLSACRPESTDSESTKTATTATRAQVEEDLTEWNHRIRREKFDLVLPEVMRKNDVDMWIHVMRETIPDPFGAEELGSTSGVFVFTDRGGDRIERAVLGRRWGDSHAGETWRVTWDTELVEESGAYDIIEDSGSREAAAGRPGDGVRLPVPGPQTSSSKNVTPNASP